MGKRYTFASKIFEDKLILSNQNNHLAYHDLRGDRGVASRSQLHDPLGQVNIFSDPELPKETINKGIQ